MARRRKYYKKPSGYFWRVRKKAILLVEESKPVPLEKFGKKGQEYIWRIAFCDLPLIIL